MNPDFNNISLVLRLPLAYRFVRKEFAGRRICYASKRNIFIDAKGNVFPCCFNRVASWGNIIDGELTQIEKSNARKIIDEKLSVNDLGSGCQFCYRAIKDGNYKAAGSSTYDSYLFSRRSFPVSMEFELSTFCNLDCIMCPEELHSSSQDSLFGKDIAEKIAPWLKNLKWAKFYGGEPFLINIYYEIWERIIIDNPGCIIKVQTNGTVLNEKVKSILEKGRFQLSVSIDSMDKENYGRIRRGADLNKVMKNMEYFIKYSERKGTVPDIAVCPMSLNAHDIPEIVKYCAENRININFNLLEFPKKYTLRYLSSEKLTAIIKEYNSIKVSGFGMVALHIRNHLRSLKNQLLIWKNEAERKEKIPVTEIEVSKIVELLVTGLSDEKRDVIEKILVEIFSEYGIKLTLRSDILERIRSLSVDEIESFFSGKEEKYLREDIRNIILYGF